MPLTAYLFSKLRTRKDVVRLMTKTPRFRTSLEIQYAKGSKTQLKSEPQHFYHHSVGK